MKIKRKTCFVIGQGNVGGFKTAAVIIVGQSNQFKFKPGCK